MTLSCRSNWKFLAVLFLLLAQGLGAIAGSVTDPSGGLIPAATVKITEQATSFSRETQELSPSVYIPGSTLSADTRRYFPQYGSIAQASHDINSSYNSLQATVEKRL